MTAPRLTRQQMLCLRLTAEGLSSQEIASREFLTVATIKSHLRGARRKLGARSTAHAVHLAHQAALFTPGPEPTAAHQRPRIHPAAALARLGEALGFEVYVRKALGAQGERTAGAP